MSGDYTTFAIRLSLMAESGGTALPPLNNIVRCVPSCSIAKFVPQDAEQTNYGGFTSTVTIYFRLPALKETNTFKV